MAYIRRKRKKWQVLIRKRFAKNIAKTFVLKEDAERYARETEAKIDKGIFVTYEEAQKTKLGELLLADGTGLSKFLVLSNSLPIYFIIYSLTKKRKVYFL